MLASVDNERRRNVLKAGTCDADAGDGLWCARYDSKPLLKANEPRGRAESARRRRAWRAVRCQMEAIRDNKQSDNGPASPSPAADEGVAPLLSGFRRAFASCRRLSRSAISS